MRRIDDFGAMLTALSEHAELVLDICSLRLTDMLAQSCKHGTQS